MSVKNEKTGEAITITLGKGDFQRTLNQEKGGTDPAFILSLYYRHYDEWARSALDFRQPRDAEEAIIGPLIDTSLGVYSRRGVTPRLVSMKRSSVRSLIPASE